jgi:hypothetical protein
MHAIYEQSIIAKLKFRVPLAQAFHQLGMQQSLWGVTEFIQLRINMLVSSHPAGTNIATL